MKTECSRIPEAVDFVSGELEAGDEAEFSLHLRECEACREDVAKLRQVRMRLVSLPRSEPKRSPEQIVASAVNAESIPVRKRMRFQRIAAAAVFMFGASVAWMAARRDEPVVAEVQAMPRGGEWHESMDRAVRWLESRQNVDGSWDAEKWGGRPEFQVALTALSMIAVRNSMDHSAAPGKAIEWLKRQQDPDGMFGPKGVGRPFNQSLATLALLRAPQAAVDAELKASIKSGIAAILRSQVPDGGWGHYGSGISNNAVTVWHVQTLELASAQGWTEVNDALERGRRSLSRMERPPSEHALAKGGRIDMCGAYFAAIQWSQRHDAESKARLNELRESLIGMQTHMGDDSGSWPPDDTRNQVGGRLFSTSLAALALNDCR